MSTKKFAMLGAASLFLSSLIIAASLSFIQRRDPYFWKTIPLIRGFNYLTIKSHDGPLFGLTRNQVESLIGSPDERGPTDSYWIYKCWQAPTFSGALYVHFSDDTPKGVVTKCFYDSSG